MEMDGHMDGAVSSCKWMELEVKMDGSIRTDTLRPTPAYGLDEKNSYSHPLMDNLLSCICYGP